MEKNSKARYLFIYTMVFAAVCLAVFFSFLKEGRSLVATVDGESQYVLYLRYMGQYLRSAVRGFIHGDFHPPMYDFSIGMGDDIGAIVRFHPLDLLSVFVPAGFTQQLYAVILFLRFYLAGLAFSAYAFETHTFSGREKFSEMKASLVNVLSGSLVYVFCGYMLIRVTNHPTYAAPFIVLPLLLLGMEKVLSGRGLFLFPAAVLLGFWSNYYFMYICSIALLAYALLRFPEVVKKDRVRLFFPYAGKLIGLYMLGLMMSMTTLLPALLRYSESYRTSQTSVMQNLLIYGDKRRYIAWFLNLISPFQSSGNGLDLNFAVIVLPCLAILFSGAVRGWRTLKWSVLLELLALLVPLFGYVFAAMNNENNRWVFLIAFSMGMCCVRTIDTLLSPGRRGKRAVVLVGIFFLVAVGVERIAAERNLYNEAGAAELLILLLLLSVIWHRNISVNKGRVIILAAVCISSWAGGYLTFSGAGGGLVYAFQEKGDTTQKYEKLSRSLAADLPEEPFSRVDSAYVLHGLENSSQYFGYNSIGMYNSILNRNLIKALLEENNVGLDAITQVHDLDGRPVSENLAHVRYYLAGRKDTAKVPYGFSVKPVLETDRISVYENEHPLSAGFSCGSYITWSDYRKLSDVEKDFVRLDAVVLPEDDAKLEEQVVRAGLSQVKKPSLKIRETSVDLPEDGNFSLKSGEKSVELSFTAKGGCTTYLRLEGLSGASDYEVMKVTGPKIRTRIFLRGDTNVHTIGREDYLINMGYREKDAEETITLEFSQEGLHSIGNAKVISISMDGYEDRIDCLNEESLRNEEIRDGFLSGSLTVKEPKLAVFTVAAKDGWSLEVDGRKAEIEVLDGMYIGALLEEGSHQIQLTYRTPGLYPGVLCMLSGLAIWVLCAAFSRMRARQREDKAL